MRISTRVILSFLLVTGLGFYFFIDWILDDLTPRYRESTEEPLVDFANVLAAQLSVTAKDGVIPTETLAAAITDATSRQLRAKIYNFEKTSVDLRVYVANDKGIVIFDSDGGRDVGKDYSTWRDVSLTLLGEYGARTSRDVPDAPSSTMYVAAPITEEGRIIGVVSVGKPTATANQLVSAAQQKFFKAAMLACAAIIVVAALLSSLVTRPIRRLTEYARAIRDGQRVPLPELGKGEIAQLGQAFVEMKEALEGRQYVERYVQTLTHEVKSPLSGIRGAVELLREDLPLDRRNQFLGNIEREASRLQHLVERLLGLSSLQRRTTLSEADKLSLTDLAKQVVAEHRVTAEAKGISLGITAGADVFIEGDKFWLSQAISNLLQNALDFTQRGGKVEVHVRECGDIAQLTFMDTGPGIPEWALPKVFDQFYSLPRPESGKKSTGLGLPLVKEVMNLHAGTVMLRNRAEGGVEALLAFRKIT